MEHEELLNKFNAHLDEYQKHREYIARAQSQAEKFSPAVIEKVVLDHEIKSTQIADDVLPLVPELEGAISAIDEEVTGIESDKSSADEQMEELTLRQAIGELTDDEFEDLGGELRETLDKANARLGELSTEHEALQGAVDRWIELAVSAGQDTGVTAADEPSEGEHVSSEPIQEDVSPVFDAADEDDAEAEPEAEEEAIEAGEADVDFGFDDEDGDVGLIEGEDGGEVELNLVEGATSQGEEGDEIGIALDGIEEEDEAEDDAAPDDADADADADAGDDDDDAGDEEEPRRALLLYQEGTAEEQIYPFHGEVLTIGRGRDNDIQIKNDSKVSRFHCKLFRRGGNFYIEDNKSSNGSLVNGEFITERRLFGGEEIIIGETFFRFRIM